MLNFLIKYFLLNVIKFFYKINMLSPLQIEKDYKDKWMRNFLDEIKLKKDLLLKEVK